MRKLNRPYLNPFASIVSALALLSSTLGCEMSPRVEEAIEIASNVGLGTDPSEIAKGRKIDRIVSEVETLLGHFESGGIERPKAIEEFQNLCDQLGELIQENVEDDDEATPIRIQDTGMRTLLEMDNLREGISALLYGTDLHDTEPRTREEISAAAKILRSSQD